MSQVPFPPESTTIGMLGSGQLGRMFCFAAHRLGYRVHVFSHEVDSPAGQAADRETVAALDDDDALRAFAAAVDVVTLEFENLPTPALAALETFVPVYPGPHVLGTTQHRLKEKRALAEAGFPVTTFHPVASLNDLQELAETGALPGILKTAAWGYDGKGQFRIDTPAACPAAWEFLHRDLNREINGDVVGAAGILEAVVDFECELSVVAARSSQGEVASYDPIRNDHANHILDVSTAPSGLPAAICREAKSMAVDVLTHLDVIGVTCVEMFLTRAGQLLINELAPRPHNSGHLTIEAHATSQFEQQVRAVCGLPLGSTAQHCPAAMVNLLGELWQAGPPPFDRILALPDASLHLYGKAGARRGRKMGHVTVLAGRPEQLPEKVAHVRQLLAPDSASAGPDNDVTGDSNATQRR